MDFKTIRYELADGILTITLNRPEQLNAFTPQMADGADRRVSRGER